MIVETLTIAIIDDEEAHFSLMKRAILQEYPYASVHHFLEASACLKKLDEIIPNVILTDYLMPGMSGIELLEILNQQSMEFPVIMITGQGDENIAAYAMKLGAKDYLVKTEDFFALLPRVIEKVVYKEKLKQSLRESDKKYKILFDGANDAIFIADIETGHILDANREAERLIGRSREEIINMHRSKIHPPDKAEYYREHFRKHIEADRIVDFDAEVIRKDGTIVPVSISANVIQLHGRKLIQGIFRDCTEQKRGEDLARNLSQRMMQAQERERQMISYELHDRIAQNLSSLKLSCDLLFDGQSNISPELKEKKINLSQEIEQTIIAVRDLSYELRPPGIDEMGLVTAIEIYCEEFSEKSGLEVEFQSAGLLELNLDDDIKIHLYRLIQEGLNNIQKHAHADRATIKLVGASPNIILRIEDNGKGFDVRERELALGKEKRMGLRSMKERVNLLGGEITIRSRLMKGTKIVIKLPLKEKNNDSEKTRHRR